MKLISHQKYGFIYLDESCEFIYRVIKTKYGLFLSNIIIYC